MLNWEWMEEEQRIVSKFDKYQRKLEKAFNREKKRMALLSRPIKRCEYMHRKLAKDGTVILVGSAFPSNE